MVDPAHNCPLYVNGHTQAELMLNQRRAHRKQQLHIGDDVVVGRMQSSSTHAAVLDLILFSEMPAVIVDVPLVIAGPANEEVEDDYDVPLILAGLHVCCELKAV